MYARMVIGEANSEEQIQEFARIYTERRLCLRAPDGLATRAHACKSHVQNRGRRRGLVVCTPRLSKAGCLAQRGWGGLFKLAKRPFDIREAHLSKTERFADIRKERAAREL